MIFGSTSADMIFGPTSAFLPLVSMSSAITVRMTHGILAAARSSLLLMVECQLAMLAASCALFSYRYFVFRSRYAITKQVLAPPGGLYLISLLMLLPHDYAISQ